MNGFFDQPLSIPGNVIQLSREMGCKKLIYHISGGSYCSFYGFFLNVVFIFWQSYLRSKIWATTTGNFNFFEIDVGELFIGLAKTTKNTKNRSLSHTRHEEMFRLRKVPMPSWNIFLVKFHCLVFMQPN